MVNKYILSPLPISFVCAFARGPSVRGDRKTDIRINIIQPINIRQKTPGWQQEQHSYQCTRGGATEIDTATCQNVAGNQPVSYRYPTTYKPYLRVAMPECDRLALSPLCIKSLKSPPPCHRSYHINQDRRPAMHEQRHWNSRWVRPLSLKTSALWYLEIKTICSIVFYRHPPTGQTNYRSPPIRQYNVLIIINNRRQSANRAYQVYEWIMSDAVWGYVN